MKKIVLVFIFSSLTTLMIAAVNDIVENPGDPKQPQQTHPTFSLATGYFSLFNIFAKSPEKSDTTRVQSIMIEPKVVIDKK